MSDTEAPVDTAAEPSGEPEAPPAPRPRRGGFVVAAVLAVIFLAVAIVMTVVAAQLRSDLDHSRGDRQDVARVSSSFGEALLSYDYRNLDQSRTKVLALATGNFAKQYQDASRRGLDEIIKGVKTVSVASVSQVYVGDVGNDTGSSIVLVNSVQAGAGGRRPFQAYLGLDLVKVGGTWKVDGVTYISADQSAGSGSTTTTAPLAGGTTTSAP